MHVYIASAKKRHVLKDSLLEDQLEGPCGHMDHPSYTVSNDKVFTLKSVHVCPISVQNKEVCIRM